MRGRVICAALVAMALAGTGRADEAGRLDSSAGPLRVERMVAGLNEPWAIAFDPQGNIWITERDGRLTRSAPDGSATTVIDGLPAVWAMGQGGLLDLVIARDFAQTGRIVFSYAKPGGAGASTALATATVRGDRLEGLRDLWVQPRPTDSAIHFAARILEDADGDLILTTGDRGEGMPAQADEGARGRVLRIAPDGSRVEEISRGHRNPQGLAVDLTGQLWASEHGAMGGDEVNRIEPGANYGWPVVAYGRNYDGSKIGEGQTKPGMTGPAHYWDPSIAPSGHLVYSGKLWAAWRGDHFFGSLKFGQIHRLEPDTAAPTGWADETIAGEVTGRVRDITEAPDGAIWYLSVLDGAAYRLTPAE